MQTLQRTAVTLDTGTVPLGDTVAEVKARGATRPSGALAAATMAPLLGFLTLMVSHHLSRLTRELDQWVHSFGYWIPGALGSGPEGSIGSYSGKETLALATWGISWLLLHLLWRRTEIPMERWLPVFLALLLGITLGFLHPVADPLVLWLAGLAGLR